MAVNGAAADEPPTISGFPIACEHYELMQKLGYLPPSDSFASAPLLRRGLGVFHHPLDQRIERKRLTREFRRTSDTRSDDEHGPHFPGPDVVDAFACEFYFGTILQAASWVPR